MSSVDERIVNMQFNNKQFNQGAADSQKSLENLEKTMANTAKSKGLEGMASSVETVKNKFSAMQVAGVAAIATIASKATLAAGNILKSFTLDPITAGFREYQTGLDSIQTIMANTGKSVKVVNAGLDQLNEFADQTIYNFGQMAKNVGTFTAAGVDLDTSISSIKGIANLAALSGSSAEQASSAMYQLSQAIASGRVNLQDWNSVVNAGMGGKNFQTALARTAGAMGTLEKSSIKLVGPMKQLKINGESFRESISASGGGPQWLTSEVLVETLGLIAEGYSDAELAAKGYSKQEIEAIQSLQKRAFEAATQIKTLPQLINVIQESIGSTWSGIFRTVVGDFKQSKKLWSDVGFVIIGPNGFLTKAQEGLEDFVKEWVDMKGREAAIDGFKTAFKALGDIFEVVGLAFRDVFPPSQTNLLFELTKNFQEFAHALTPSEETLKNLRSIFAGFFAVLDIGWQLISAAASALGDLFGVAGEGSGGFLSLAATIGELLVTFAAMVREADVFAKIFQGLGVVLMIPLKLLGLLFGVIEDIPEAFGDLVGFMEPMMEKIAEVFGGLGEVFANSLSSGGFDNVLSVIQTGLLGGIVLLLKKFLANGISVDVGGGLFSSVKDSFDALTGSMRAMQTQIQAKTLLLIAGAIALLTASVVALSLINVGDLKKALTAMSVSFIQLLAAMAVLIKMSAGGGILKVNAVAAAMVLVASSILILSGAVAVLAQLSWEQLLKGLSGVAGIITAIALGMRLMPKGMLLQAAALAAIAVSINILAAAVIALSFLSWEQIGKGLAAIGGALVVIAGAMRLMPKGILLQSAALVALGTALNLIAAAIGSMGKLSWEEIGKGIAGIAGALVIIAAAMHIMPKGMVAQSAALLVLSGALFVIGKVIANLGGLSWEEIGKGLAAIGGALLILAGGLYLMSGAIAGAAALVIAAGALAILAPVLVILGNMSWEEIGKGLATLAGLFIILGAAGLLLTPVIPSILGLAAAVTLLGLGLALAGVGMLAFGTGFAILAASSVAGTAVIIGAIEALLDLVPSIATAIALAFVAFVQTIAANAPIIAEAFTIIFESILGVVSDAIPMIGKLLQRLIDTGIGIIRRSIPQWIEMGWTIIDAFLTSASDHIPHIADVVGDMIVDFIKAIDKDLQRIIQAGTDLIVHFLEGIGEASGEITTAAGDMVLDILDAIDAAVVTYSSEFRSAGLSIASHLLDGLTGGLAGKVGGAVADVGGWAGDLLGRGVVGRGASGRVAQTPAQAVAAAVKIANAVIAGRSKAVADAQKVARAKEAVAAAADARADIAADKLRAAQKSKAGKKRIKELQRQADKQRQIADQEATISEAAARRVEKVREFEQAELHGKGDIRSEASQALASRANEMLARANAEAAEARKLMRTNQKAGRALLAQSRKDAAEAKKLADAARKANQDALKFYAQEVEERIKQIEADAAAEEQARKDQEAYDAADAKGKSDILTARAEANEAEAERQRALAEQLIAQAKVLAATDAARAMELLDQAEKAAQDAQDAADKAEQEREQAQQVLGGGTGGGGGPSSVQPSRSVLEDAARSIDRYTASLQQAAELAGAAAGPVQYVQNNYSPEALSASEIYRQSKNLLSATEVKMGETPVPTP